MPRVGFEHMTPVFGRPKTVLALDWQIHEHYTRRFVLDELIPVFIFLEYLLPYTTSEREIKLRCCYIHLTCS
jgi:hypothetical protein